MIDIEFLIVARILVRFHAVNEAQLAFKRLNTDGLLLEIPLRLCVQVTARYNDTFVSCVET